MLCKKCPECKKEVEFGHFHSSAHGFEETHMAGTERFICPECGKTYYKHESEKLGFKFLYD